jgi:hypothetical protein
MAAREGFQPEPGTLRIDVSPEEKGPWDGSKGQAPKEDVMAGAGSSTDPAGIREPKREKGFDDAGTAGREFMRFEDEPSLQKTALLSLTTRAGIVHKTGSVGSMAAAAQMTEASILQTKGFQLLCKTTGPISRDDALELIRHTPPVISTGLMWTYNSIQAIKKQNFKQHFETYAYNYASSWLEPAAKKEESAPWVAVYDDAYYEQLAEQHATAREATVREAKEALARVFRPAGVLEAPPTEITVTQPPSFHPGLQPVPKQPSRRVRGKGW